MYCNTNPFPALPFFGSLPKPHGARGLNNNYRLRFDPKLGRGICVIRCIPCAYAGCTSMLDKPCIYGIQSTKQARYQPVTNCTYWPVLGSYKNWNTIEITPKSIPFKAFDDIHKVVLDRMSKNMASLVQ